MSILILILFTIMIGAIAYSYYQDYKRDKKTVSKVFKNACLLIVLFFSYGGLQYLYEHYIPVYQSFGPAYNTVRTARSIPLIEGNWYEQQYRGDQFEKWYVNPGRDTIAGHTHKIITFNYWTAAHEEDFFHNPHSSQGLVSTYSYFKNKQEYFLLSPMTLLADNMQEGFVYDFVNEFFEMERPPISKPQFDQILQSWK